jgi:hypothetical protein
MYAVVTQLKRSSYKGWDIQAYQYGKAALSYGPDDVRSLKKFIKSFYCVAGVNCVSSCK